MHSRSQNKTPVKFIAAVIGLTAFTMVMTATIGYLVTSMPRGIMFWGGVGFLCTIEFLVGILYVNTFARDRCEYRPSGAILAITYGIVGGFALSGFLSIAVYWLIRDEKGSKDGIFSGVLMAIILFWFIIAFFLYAYDLHAQSINRPVQEKRIEHQGYSQRLKPILHVLRMIRTDSDTGRRNLDIMIKKIEAIQVVLSHSHGGGVGSWESNRSNLINSEQDQLILNGIDSLHSILPRLSGEHIEDHKTAFAELEQCIGRISLAVDAQGL